jgi:hypothetical protein
MFDGIENRIRNAVARRNVESPVAVHLGKSERAVLAAARSIRDEEQTGTFDGIEIRAVDCESVIILVGESRV